MFRRSGAKAAMLGFALLALDPSRALSADGMSSDLTRATSGPTYFNKPNASLDEHARQLRDCFALAKPASSARVTGAGLVPDVMQGAQSDARTQANIENCMVARGWRVVRMNSSAASALRGLPQPELAERLAKYVGAEHPVDPIARTFTNEAARGDTVWGAMPGFLPQEQLSVRAVDLSGVASSPRRNVRVAKRNPPWAVLALKPDQLDAAGPDKALILVQVFGNGQTNGEGFNFDRAPPEGARPELGAYDVDGQPDTFYAGVKWTMVKGSSSEKRETAAVFAAPPGRWRFSQKMGTLDFCLGAPAFDVKAGDVVFIGSLDLVGNLGPNMDPAPARALLREKPDLMARLKAVDWIEDTTAPCSGVYSYRLETRPH